MKKSLTTLLFAVFFLPLFSQNPLNLSLVKKAIELNKELEFSELCTYFDTAGKKPERRCNPSTLHHAWSSMRDSYGQFVSSVTKYHFTRNNIEYVGEELEFDSGYVLIRFGFSADNKISSYLMRSQQSKADRALEESYKLPAYADVSKVKAREVKFGASPFILEGELTLPKKGKKLPAVVLVHGSGPNDRDEKNGPIRMFKDLAYGLSTRGIVVLRYDKRAFTYPDECATDTGLTIDKETTLDALEAVKFLRMQKNVDPKRIFIIGHSLGAMMAPRMAVLDSGLAGIVLMGGPAQSLPDKVIQQMHYLMTLYPENKVQYQNSIDEFLRIKEKKYSWSTKPIQLPYGLPPSYWFSLDAYNQVQVAQNLTLPIFINHGGRDYQIDSSDYAIWRAALGNKSNVAFSNYYLLNHMFTEGNKQPGLSTPDDYKVPGNVPEYVINGLEAFIKEHR